MKKFLLDLVSGEREEWPQISLLLAVGFVSGFLVATYTVGTTTLFLKHYDEKTYVPIGFAASGVLGIISTFLFSYYQNVITYSRLSLFAILFNALLIVGLSIGLNIYENNEMIFVAYVFLGPINSLSVLIFWGLFGRLFSYRAAKRLSGGIDTGQAISAIIGFFTLPLVLQIIIKPAYLLFISSGCIIIMLLLYLVMFRKFRLEAVGTKVRARHDGDSKGEIKPNLSTSIFKDRYVFLMAAFVTLSLSGSLFVNYSYLTVTADYFSGNERQLANYLSFFDGTVMICSFLVQTFLNDKILEIYGLRAGLLLLPGILFIFTVIAVFVGNVFGYTPAAGGAFLFFFLVVSISKLFTDALRDSLESPALKIFFFPLDASVRFNIQAKIEGSVKQSSGLITGGLLFLFLGWHLFDVMYNSYIIFVVVACWVYATFRMYKEYKRVLTDTLKVNRPRREVMEQNAHLMTYSLVEWEIEKKRPETLVHLLRILEKIEPVRFMEWLETADRMKDEKSEVLALKKIDLYNQMLCSEVVKKIYKKSSSKNQKDLSELAVQVEMKFFSLVEIEQDYEKLHGLITSRNPADRALAASLLNKTHPEAFQSLLLMLRDLNPKVRRAAILTVSQKGFVELLPVIAEYLGRPGYENLAFSVLAAAHESAIPALESAFNKNGQSHRIMMDVVKLYGRMRSMAAQKKLIEKIDFPDKKIFNEVLQALYLTAWRAGEEDVIHVKSALQAEVASSVWNIAALEEIDDNRHTFYLKKALNEELEYAHSRIFILLSLLYDRDSVRLVKENIESGTSDGIGYAIELLNIFLDDELKPIVIPMLDELPPNEKVKKYEIFFPRERLDSREVLLQIINRDYNSTNRWTKACAIYAYIMRADAVLTDDLVANLFNPDPFMLQTAAWAVCKLDEERYEEYNKRMDPEVVRELNKIVVLAAKATTVHTLQLLMLEKVKFLIDVPLFKGVPGVLLSEIVEFMEELHFGKGDILLPENDMREDMPLYIVVSGKIGLKRSDKLLTVFRDKQVVNDLFSGSAWLNGAEAVALENSIVFKIDSLAFFEMLANHVQLAESVVGNLISDLTEEPMMVI